jgi:transposase
MYNVLPVITENANVLKQRLQHEHNSRKKPWLRMLYLLASGRAHTRQDVAQLLGIHRDTIGRWLAHYKAGSLASQLELYVPVGKPSSLRPDLLAARAQALRQPAGIASYEAVQ